MTTLTPENYIMKFGKYCGMKAIDVANIRITDKNGKERREGLRYLKWVCQKDWFKHTSIIEQIISGVDDDEQQGDDEKEIKPKPIEKKKKKEPKEPKATKNVQIKLKPTDESNILDFN
jgi:hypothetical protein